MPVTTAPPQTHCNECYDLPMLTIDGTDDNAVPLHGGWYHRTCLVPCDGCGVHRSRYESREATDGRRLCSATCAMTCEGMGANGSACDRFIPRDGGTRRCPAHQVQPEVHYTGVRGYQRTRPFLWLGGEPATDEKGKPTNFHIGFELEVSSEAGYRSRVTSLHQWAKDHLGHWNALDYKEDCSVSGFEIVSQPMTPEFFEDQDWESFFDLLNRDHRPWDGSPSKEPSNHGLHVHISREAFNLDDTDIAMFCYLIGQDESVHLERVARRVNPGYAARTDKPAIAAISMGYQNGRKKPNPQAARIGRRGGGRGAINLSNPVTLEIRAFRSTRNPEDLKAAVRLVYLGAQYIQHLRAQTGGLVSPKALRFDSFLTWVESVHPQAVEGLRP